jgi:hypothetical protein
LAQKEHEKYNEVSTKKDWSGVWITNFNKAILKQYGRSVEGSYDYSNGRIIGFILGNKLIGEWSDEPTYSPPDNRGDIEFLISDDYESFEGNWRYGSTALWSETSWKGKR